MKNQFEPDTPCPNRLGSDYYEQETLRKPQDNEKADSKNS